MSSQQNEADCSQPFAVLGARFGFPVAGICARACPSTFINWRLREG